MLNTEALRSPNAIVLMVEDEVRPGFFQWRPVLSIAKTSDPIILGCGVLDYVVTQHNRDGSSDEAYHTDRAEAEKVADLWERKGVLVDEDDF